MANNEFQTLKNDIKNGNVQNFYVFYGEEVYLKSFYMKKIEEMIINGGFADFNLEKFDETNFELENFNNAIESLPAMAEKKLILVRDFDLFKMKAEIKDKIIEILSNLPDYVCLIFDYATIEFKEDKRQKISKIINEFGNVIEFEYLSQKDVNLWIKKKFTAENIEISDEICEYLTFVCSASLTNLTNECEKLILHCKEKVTKNDINNVCSKVLEAKIFDVADRILENDIFTAQNLINDLIFLKTNEFTIASVINSHFQRLYSAKLGAKQNKNEKFYMDLWGTRSSYAVKISLSQSSKYDIDFLRKACNLCVKTLIDMVSINGDKIEMLQILVVKLGAINVKNK